MGSISAQYTSLGTWLEHGNFNCTDFHIVKRSEIVLFCSHCSSNRNIFTMALCGNSSLGSATMWAWSVFTRGPCWRIGLYLESISGREWIRRVLTCSMTSSIDIFIIWWCYWKMMKSNLGGGVDCGGSTLRMHLVPRFLLSLPDSSLSSLSFCFLPPWGKQTCSTPLFFDFSHHHSIKGRGPIDHRPVPPETRSKNTLPYSNDFCQCALQQLWKPA